MAQRPQVVRWLVGSTTSPVKRWVGTRRNAVRSCVLRTMNGTQDQAGPWGQARILLVEDDANVRAAVDEAHILGWETESVASGEDGLAAFGRSAFDLVLLDLGLPGLPGVEVLRQLRARSEVPVLVMTASGALDDRVNGFDLGADDYVVKPFEIAELERRVRAILRRTTGPRPDDVLHGPADIRLFLRAHEAYVGEEAGAPDAQGVRGPASPALATWRGDPTG